MIKQAEEALDVGVVLLSSVQEHRQANFFVFSESGFAGSEYVTGSAEI